MQHEKSKCNSTAPDPHHLPTSNNPAFNAAESQKAQNTPRSLKANLPPEPCPCYTSYDRSHHVQGNIREKYVNLKIIRAIYAM